MVTCAHAPRPRCPLVLTRQCGRALGTLTYHTHDGQEWTNEMCARTAAHNHVNRRRLNPVLSTRLQTHV
jgi:hypothetical protein